VLAVAVAMTASCAISKASIDYTLSEGILWPGKPEKPRIMYLWSMQRVAGSGGGGKLLDFLAGEGAHVYPDPRESEILIRPHSVYVDGMSRMYVTDLGALRVTVIDLNTMDSFHIDDINGFPFFSPVGVVSDDIGRIYVTDSNLTKVMVFDEKGEFLKKFEGDFKRPTGIAINNKEGRVYVADTWEHEVYIYDLEGKRIGTVGQRGEGPGKLNYPTHVALDRDGYLYVSDTLNFRVQIFNPMGEFVNAFGIIGDTFSTFDKIKGIAVDSEGHIYVADSAQDMVKIFDRNGRLLLFFGGKGHFYGKFSLPAGLYISKEDDIFVVDSLNRRVQAFRFMGGD
jgi:DNA-binding beta-propeller fold protein YncE